VLALTTGTVVVGDGRPRRVQRQRPVIGGPRLRPEVPRALHRCGPAWRGRSPAAAAL